MASEHEPGARPAGGPPPREPAGPYPATELGARAELADVRERAAQARRDVDAAQAARRAAEASAARLRAMVAGLNAVVWEQDPVTLRIRFVNDRIEELLGHPVGAWTADPDLWRRTVHADDRERAMAAVGEAIEVGQDFTITYRARAADGRLVWLHHLGHVARDETGTATAIHAVLIDVTEQNRREQAGTLLAAAGRLLAAPDPVEERLAAVAELTVGALCERASVWLRGDDGRYRIVAAAPADFAPRV